jgi:hypothetical protein
MCIATGNLAGKKLPLDMGIYLLSMTASLTFSMSLYIVFVQFAGSYVLLICLMAVTGSAALVFTYYYKQLTCIVCTSFVGSYGFMRGWALLLGGFPGEVRLF